MNDVRSRSRRLWIVTVAVVFLAALYGPFCLRVLLARREGLSIGEALRTALSLGELAHWGWAAVAAAALGLSMYLLVIRRGAGGHGTAPGAAIWRRLRRVAVIGALGVLAFVAIGLAYFLMAAEGPEGWEWIPLLLMGVFAAAALLFYLRKPTREYLHALETGDLSRLQDERAQRVGGAAAAITLNLFVPILLFGGVLYEVLFRGEWPIRTGLEVGVILLIWGLAGRHWNRVL